MEFKLGQTYYLVICSKTTIHKTAGIVKFLFDENMSKCLAYNANIYIPIETISDLHKNFVLTKNATIFYKEARLDERHGMCFGIFADEIKAKSAFKKLIKKNTKIFEEQSEEARITFEQNMDMLRFLHQVNKI